jgi:predicted RNA-binding protein YlqC (UPF0109 family)
MHWRHRHGVTNRRTHQHHYLTEEPRALVEEIARALVDAPEEVSVEAVSDGQLIMLQLRVAEEDKGKIIGKQGRTAGSMRTILSAIGRKMQKRFVLEILE